MFFYENAIFYNFRISCGKWGAMFWPVVIYTLFFPRFFYVFSVLRVVVFYGFNILSGVFRCLLFLISAQIIQSEDKCSNNPSACTTNEICIISTILKNGKVLWQGESVKEYVLEAKKRNLTEEICAKKNY